MSRGQFQITTTPSLWFPRAEALIFSTHYSPPPPPFSQALNLLAWMDAQLSSEIPLLYFPFVLPVTEHPKNILIFFVTISVV